jgi:uncharacterized membrane protein YgcG
MVGNVPQGSSALSPRFVRNVRLGLAAFAVAVLLLIFAVPQATPPPATLASPNEAFLDHVGIVSPEFARQWAGGLLNDDRAQIVVYVDRKPPEGDLASWAIQTASDWRIGASKNDTGLVLFVFTEPRVARLDVGYGLEAVITDARARQLLETHLLPAFAAGEYERGFDALIFALRKEIGGDDAESIHARAAEARKRDDIPWMTQIGIAIKRMPRVLVSIVRTFLEANAGERLAILIMASVGLAVAAVGTAMAAKVVSTIVSVPARMRAHAGQKIVIAAAAFEVGLGLAVVFFCVSLVALVMLAAESMFMREGRFSGAGSMIVWPQLAR